MWRLLQVSLQLTVLLIVCTQPIQGFLCKWSNEKCKSDDECCSKRCEQAHPGTDQRCMKCVLEQPCLKTYQCESGLKCGERKKKCCSDEWGTCRNASDCCNELHYCLEVKGFYYKRCLVGIPSTATSLPAPCFSFFTLVLFHAPFYLYNFN